MPELNHMERKLNLNSEQEIDFVFFDLGNILFSFDPLRACQNVARKYDLDAQVVESAVYGTGLQSDFESGHIRQDIFVQQVCVNLGLQEQSIESQELLDCLSDMFSPIPSMLEAVGRVQSQGCPTGVLSNTCRSHWSWINRISTSNVLNEFAEYILSFEVGAMKPNAAIYDAAEQAAEVPPEKILFLDDRQENIDAALHRGWQAHCCLGGKDAESTLQSYGFGA